MLGDHDSKVPEPWENPARISLYRNHPHENVSMIVSHNKGEPLQEKPLDGPHSRTLHPSKIVEHTIPALETLQTPYRLSEYIQVCDF
jgi:hypothetical protein